MLLIQKTFSIVRKVKEKRVIRNTNSLNAAQFLGCYASRSSFAESLQNVPRILKKKSQVQYFLLK